MKLIKKEFLDFDGYVYNIEVEDNHNYFVENILVSNCYLNCTEDKPHADLTNPILDTVHAGTEMAINANDMTHPGLEDFLIRMKEKGVFVNITINQKHLKQNVDKLKDWQNRELVWGIGISLTNSTDPILWENGLENTVLHVIDGCLSKTDLENLSNHNVKMLILGFKHKGRGVDYYNDHKEEVDSNIEYLKNHLYDYRDKFNGFGFDNLSTLDLEVQKMVSPEQWKTNHMGEEGEFTMFLSLVDNTYAISSMETEKIFKVEPNDTVDTIFHKIRVAAGHE